ncbi:MAG: AAA family ATPase, partial [Formivibrio sp.]|nr:AAA family ATPase [Formivibrio sp.]
CTPGNLTTISAQAKAGKSAAIGAMIASTFAADGADCLGFVSENPEGFAVVHLDTEQSRYDHWQGIQRAVRRAKVNGAPSWLRSYSLTGFPAADVRASIRILTAKAAKEFGGVHSVFIDGIADAAPDVNDASETSSLIIDLHELAIEFDCPILNIIHVNPGSDFKTRGHLGSQLERKSETNLRLEKDGDEISVIWADKNRRAPIPKTSGPCFCWNEDAGMHTSVQNPSEAKAEARTDARRMEMQREAQTVFAEGENPFRHTDLVSKMEVSLGMSAVGAKKKLARWVVSQVVTIQPSGLYTLTP